MKKPVMMAALLLAAFGAQAADTAGNPVGNPAAARGKVSMCIGCHGIADYRTAYPEVYRVPKLGGQSAQYIATALKEYKSGQRKFQTMRAITASLSDQDIADLAAYYAGQTSTSKSDPLK